MIPNSEINGLVTLDTMFRALSHYGMSRYSTGDKGLLKTDKLPNQLGLLHYENPISNQLVFQWLPISFSWLILWKKKKNMAQGKSPSDADLY